jgi:hypothetical protein
MFAFTEWIVAHDLVDLLRLLEAAAFFNPQDYNTAFKRELESLAQRIEDPTARQQIAAMENYDWGSYIERSLLRAGFRGDDVQEQFQGMVIKLLVSPGRLFRGWNPQQHGELHRRFKRSVWNAILNAQEKTRNRRRWMVTADPTTMAERNPAKEPYPADRQDDEGLISGFRRFVRNRLGGLGIAVLDARISGEETKNLVGREEFGSPGKHVIKRVVQEVKALAREYAQQLGDSAFLRGVQRAMEREGATIQRRLRSTLARHTG